MKTILTSKPILKGLLLSLLLTTSAIALSGILSPGSPYGNIPRIPATNYTWDFSSGLSLSQSYDDQEDEILAFSTHVTNVTSVYGETDDIEVECNPECDDNTFAWGGYHIPYYDYNTSSVRSYYNTETMIWKIDISRYLTSSDFNGRTTVVIDQLPYGNLSSTLKDAIKTVEDLNHVTHAEFGQAQREEFTRGSIYYEISQSYQSGVNIRLFLLNSKLFISVTYFDHYYANDDVMGFESDDPDTETDYYLGTLDQFFQGYTGAINGFLGIFLGN